MKASTRISLCGAAVVAAALSQVLGTVRAQKGLVVVGFHHVHMNVVDPPRSADFYVNNFHSRAVNVAGWGGVQTEDIYILFNKVRTQALYDWDTPIWHFGWSSPALNDDYRRIAANGVKFFRVPPPSAHAVGPDDNDVEIAPAGGQNSGGSGPRAFNHVHLQSEAPWCAGDWYEQVLGLRHPPDTSRVAGADCRVPFAARGNPANQILNPSTRVFAGDVALFIAPHQRLAALSQSAVDAQGPLVSPRGRVLDHIALLVVDVPAALQRVREHGVAVLEDAHMFGNTKLKAAMIEGPDRIAIELVEAPQ